MKNKLLYVILVVAVCIGVQGFAAEVTNVELSYVNGSTIANIHVDGTVRFTHQTEEAKDGKPFRVIVDVLSAVHELGAKNFMRLPQCSIEKLRTSQFSTSPEKIVRLVFDMSKETFYSIDSDERSITVTFPDKAHKPFTAWSSQSVVRAMKAEKKDAPKLATVTDTPKTPAIEKTRTAQAKTVGAINKSIENDRQASLASTTPKVAKSTSKPAETKPVVTAEKKRADVPYNARNTYGPDYDPDLFAYTAPVKEKSVAKAKDVKEDVTSKAKPEVAKAETKKDPVVASKPKTAPAKTEPKPSIKKATTAAKTPTMAKAESGPKTTPAQKPTSTKTVKQDKKPAAAKAKTTTVASKPAAKKTKTATVASKPKKQTKSSTSRFRRSADSKKVKGTLVAEFPKRLVIKYKSRSTRDPFETLVNDSRVNNSVIEKSVPNVEGLQLVGVIESLDGDNRALFEDNSGYGYILKSGDKVRKGYVLRVESNRVFFQIFEYGWSRTVALNLEEN